jgi:hypothetical protein
MGNEKFNKPNENLSGKTHQQKSPSGRENFRLKDKVGIEEGVKIQTKGIETLFCEIITIFQILGKM